MSILIKGMEIPKGCYREHESCPCYKSFKGWAWCGITEKQIINGFNQRPQDCPLIELPPHGRLIDADALMGRIEHDTPLSSTFEKVMRWYTENAPTIIESEGNDG